MSQPVNYLECWTAVATSLFAQALVGEPALTESLPKPLPAGSFGFVANIAGDEQGRFAIMLDGELVEAPFFGEGSDQKAGWAELLKETVEAAAGELLAKTGKKCQVTSFLPIVSENKLSRAFQLASGGRSWVVLVNSDLRLPKADDDAVKPAAKASKKADKQDDASAKATPSANAAAERPDSREPEAGAPPRKDMGDVLSPGLQLLLDVELEASLRFGSREMPLGEILDLGPGDVVQLDRHVSDPVDLIVGDKIVARGEVVLVNGNFGLRVTEVAEPQRRLESIRCLF
uniref:Putative flagellar motor switch protein FliN (Modular protein) n=1 Tax=mine drainage metagenome TaxID=410659 RepID=E6PZF5_9ZZZZ